MNWLEDVGEVDQLIFYFNVVKFTKVQLFGPTI